MKFFRIFYVAIILSLSGYLYLNYENRLSAIHTAEEWARLQPLPACASKAIVTTDGGMFSREIIINFSCDRESLAQWVNSSPGLKDAKVSLSGPSKNGKYTNYKISPGGGAMFAFVQINWKSNAVYIRTYWS